MKENCGIIVDSFRAYYCSGQVPRPVLCTHIQRHSNQLQDDHLQRVGEAGAATGYWIRLRGGPRRPGLRQGIVFCAFFFLLENFYSGSFLLISHLFYLTKCLFLKAIHLNKG